MKYFKLVTIIYLSAALFAVLTSCKSASFESTSLGRKDLQNLVDAENKAEFQPVCLNKSASDTAFVYLHGMDVATVSEQEKANREKLLRIAQNLHVSVVVPRATSICPANTNQICWGWKFDQAELTQLKARIASAVVACGAKKIIALVGFSNGGYAVNALHSRCEGDAFGKLISIGAMSNVQVMTLKYNQACAGQMVRLIGQQDNLNSSPATLKLVTDNKLENLIQVVEFDGAHEIPESVLQVQLESWLKQIN